MNRNSPLGTQYKMSEQRLLALEAQLKDLVLHVQVLIRWQNSKDSASLLLSVSL